VNEVVASYMDDTADAKSMALLWLEVLSLVRIDDSGATALRSSKARLLLRAVLCSGDVSVGANGLPPDLPGPVALAAVACVMSARGKPSLSGSGRSSGMVGKSPLWLKATSLAPS
jgi:hypothetical protein